MSPDAFVGKLFTNAGANPTQAERQAAIDAYGGGNCVTVFIYSVYSMKETKTLSQLQAGMELSAQKCKPCPRSKT